MVTNLWKSYKIRFIPHEKDELDTGKQKYHSQIYQISFKFSHLQVLITKMAGPSLSKLAFECNSHNSKLNLTQYKYYNNKKYHGMFQIITLTFKITHENLVFYVCRITTENLSEHHNSILYSILLNTHTSTNLNR